MGLVSPVPVVRGGVQRESGPGKTDARSTGAVDGVGGGDAHVGITPARQPLHSSTPARFAVTVASPATLRNPVRDTSGPPTRSGVLRTGGFPDFKAARRWITAVPRLACHAAGSGMCPRPPSPTQRRTA